MLQERVAEEARRRQTSKSKVIRDCLEQSLLKPSSKKSVTCLDLVTDLIGSQPGPRDASVNQAYLKDFGRERKHHR